jgi:hypothetical protein
MSIRRIKALRHVDFTLKNRRVQICNSVAKLPGENVNADLFHNHVREVAELALRGQICLILTGFISRCIIV